MTEAQAVEVVAGAAVLLVQDINASAAFYMQKLNFTIDRLHGEPPSFAMAEFGPATIMLKQSEGGPRQNHASLRGMWDVYLWVRDIDAVEIMLKTAGIPILRGPEMTPHGCTEIEIEDPDGHIIAFGFCP